MAAGMIRQVKRRDLDLEAYDRLVTGCSTGLPYAESWFLDALTGGNWKVLVSGDYEAVLPLPVKRSTRHFFRKVIAQPIMCQQLGVYGAGESPHTAVPELYERLYEMRPFAYSFNFNEKPPEPPPGLKLLRMPNYVLSTKPAYIDLYGEYSTNLRRNLRKAKKTGLRVEVSRDVRFAEELIRFKNSTMKSGGQWVNLSRQSRLKYAKPAMRLMRAALERKSGVFAKVVLDGELLSAAFSINTIERSVYLIAATNSKGKSMGAGHFLVDGIIRKIAGRNVVLDFEGSKVPGIARFFKMFGSVDQPYYHLHR